MSNVRLVLSHNYKKVLHNPDTWMYIRKLGVLSQFSVFNIRGEVPSVTKFLQFIEVLVLLITPFSILSSNVELWLSRIFPVKRNWKWHKLVMRSSCEKGQRKVGVYVVLDLKGLGKKEWNKGISWIVETIYCVRTNDNQREGNVLLKVFPSLMWNVWTN